MKSAENIVKLSFKNGDIDAGFTLIELMVTIAVLAIIVSIAAPNISTQLANQRVKSTAATLADALREAKVESRILRQPLTLKYDDNNKVISIQNIVSNKVVTTISNYKYDAETTIKSTSTSNEFRPNNTANATTYNICDSKAKVGSRQIIVNSVGIIVIKIGGTCV